MRSAPYCSIRASSDTPGPYTSTALWGGVIVFSSSVGVFTGVFIILWDTVKTRSDCGLLCAECQTHSYIYGLQD
jgi:hypothetical protein